MNGDDNGNINVNDNLDGDGNDNLTFLIRSQERKD